MQRRYWSWGCMLACAVVLALAASRQAEAGGAPSLDPVLEWIRWGNGLRTEALIFNALTTNPSANLALTANPLNSDSFLKVPELRNALHDPAAQIFMKYLVSCALMPDQQVTWTPSLTGYIAHTWSGGGGLCKDWNIKPPSSDCLELVSACILARNNPAGARVRIFLGGGGKVDPPISLMPMSRVVPDQFIPSKLMSNGLIRPAQPIDSFHPCDESTGHECGWRPLFVGGCFAGSPVRVSVYASKGASVCGSLRACPGAQGCTADNEVGEKGPFCEGGDLDLTCPKDNTFSVMTSFSSTTSGPYDDLWDSLKVTGANAHIMGEDELFPVREGAFYGNLFGSGAIMPGLSVTFDPTNRETVLRIGISEYVYIRQADGWCKRLAADPPTGNCTPDMPRVGSGQPVYEHLYVCSAPGWVGNPVDLPGRVCALPDNKDNCAAHLMDSCLTSPGGDCQDYGFLDLCQGREPQRWAHPITTFMSK